MHGQQNDKYTEIHGQKNDKYTEMHSQQNDKYTEMHGQQNVKINFLLGRLSLVLKIWFISNGYLWAEGPFSETPYTGN